MVSLIQRIGFVEESRCKLNLIGQQTVFIHGETVNVAKLFLSSCQRIELHRRTAADRHCPDCIGRIVIHRIVVFHGADIAVCVDAVVGFPVSLNGFEFLERIFAAVDVCLDL